MALTCKKKPTDLEMVTVKTPCQICRSELTSFESSHANTQTNYIHSYLKQVFQPADRTAETYAGRNGTMLINHKPINVRKSWDKRTEGRADVQIPDRCFKLSQLWTQSE